MQYFWDLSESFGQFQSGPLKCVYIYNYFVDLCLQLLYLFVSRFYWSCSIWCVDFCFGEVQITIHLGLWNGMARILWTPGRGVCLGEEHNIARLRWPFTHNSIRLPICWAISPFRLRDTIPTNTTWVVRSSLWRGPQIISNWHSAPWQILCILW